MNRFDLVLALAVVSLLTASAAGQEQPKAPPAADPSPSVWMRKKLEYSQEILAGITIGDYGRIAQNARAMNGLTKIEAFFRTRTPGYKTQLQIFAEANEEIIRQADEDNLEGAALAFTQLTISCVNCHKQLRKIEKD